MGFCLFTFLNVLEIGAVSSDSHKFKAGRLTEGTEYYFRVAAQNAIGTGPFNQSDGIVAKLPYSKWAWSCAIGHGNEH